MFLCESCQRPDDYGWSESYGPCEGCGKECVTTNINIHAKPQQVIHKSDKEIRNSTYKTFSNAWKKVRPPRKQFSSRKEWKLAFIRAKNKINEYVKKFSGYSDLDPKIIFKK
jgi:hypothetical protein